jgi:hypothetical protein
LRAADLCGVTLAQAIRSGHQPPAVVRPALLHLLWQQHFLVDLARPIIPAHVLGRRA